MIVDHVGITCADLEAAKRFYDAALGALGHRRVMDVGVAVGYGSESPDFWLSSPEAEGPNRESHLAFTAADVASVHAFHAAATEHGATTLHEPRLWPEYHAGYFAVFVRDPDGNNVEAVFHGAAPTAD
jgi:catechol 2,3-dioxygenase-like lactoylglutathione lyase family enzyme